MKINCYKTWWIRSDARNIILGKLASTTEDANTGKIVEIWVDETYHNTVEQALKRLWRTAVNGSKVTTFAGLEKEYRRMNDVLEDIRKKLGE